MSRGDRLRQLSFRPWVLYCVGTFVPLILLTFIGASAWLVFHDDVLSTMLRRQNEMQYAYEDRLAALRAQVDRVTGRQLLDQDTLEGRVHELISRQAQIENRTAIIAALADQAGVSREATASIPKPDMRIPAAAKTANARTPNPLLPPLASRPALPAGVSAFAPVSAAQPAFSSVTPAVDEKPRPEIPEQRSDLSSSRMRILETLASPAIPVETKLRALNGSLESLELSQLRAVSQIGGAARQTASRLRTAIAETGLSADRLSLPASGAKPVGGPFIPLKADPKGSLFEREVYRLQSDFAASDKLRRLVPHLPMRKPLQGQLDVTSPFGGRADPFFGRLATHSGVDLREQHGSPVRVTGAGKVVSAGWSGGYGNMIEVDHGNGLTTRYAHLSAILVAEDQSLEAGAVIGKLGSTGRSTGPHLHYEVRINNEAVDPQRFLRAGARLYAGG